MIWQPATPEERHAGQRLYEVLTALHRPGLSEPEIALTTLDQVGRVCVRILGEHYARAPEQVSLTDLVKTLSPVVAPVVARWAGACPEDDEVAAELPDDLAVLAEHTDAVRHTLARALQLELSTVCA